MEIFPNSRKTRRKKKVVNPQDRMFKVEAHLDALDAVAMGKTKKEARQRAAQLLLRQLHPDVDTWGEILDLYRLGLKAREMDQRLEQPNLRLLEKLKEEMRKQLAHPPPGLLAASRLPPRPPSFESVRIEKVV